MTVTQTPSIPDAAANPRKFLEYLFNAAVTRALPLQNTAAHLPQPPKGRTIVIGAGKAGGSMVHALEALWPLDAPLEGLVVTRYHHIPHALRGCRNASRLLKRHTRYRMPQAWLLPSASWPWCKG